VDGELPVLDDQDDDFEEIASPIGAEDEPSIRVFAHVFDGEGVVHRMRDVVVCDSVAASGTMDLHTEISYYEITTMGSAQPGWAGVRPGITSVRTVP
jgi:hypothetical protein